MERLAARVLKFSDADETEVDIGSTVDALTRFANNTIHQNVAEQNLSISIRTVVDGRTARATTNKTDDESLRRAVAAAVRLAHNQPKNPDLLPMLRSQKYQKVARHFAATAETTPQDRARAVTRVCKMADKTKQTAAGIFATASTQSILANSRGLFAHYEQTRAEFSVTILEDDSSGWAKANSPDVRKIDPDALAESASRKAATSRKPRELAPGHYTVILEPPAVLDLVGFLFYDFAGTAIRDKRSCFTGRIGQENPRRQRHALGRRVPSAANRPALRRRRCSAAKGFAGGSRHAEKSCLFARQRQENESKTHWPRLLAAERLWRSADEPCFRAAATNPWTK